jgi:hypothetical protein
MVDSSANEPLRRQLASELVTFMKGEIGSNVFDDRLDEIWRQAGQDRYLGDLCQALWASLYDDFKNHFIRVNDEGWQALKRHQAFLHTDGSFAWPRRKGKWPFFSRLPAAPTPFAPFAGEEHWRANCHVLEPYGLPVNAPVYRGRPPGPVRRGWDLSWPRKTSG